ncbi:MAG: hypothetical protein KTR31_02185 [Myxococcales bacterium]|nr:hypothetical protein [Myxococcales bacterium]
MAAGWDFDAILGRVGVSSDVTSLGRAIRSLDNASRTNLAIMAVLPPHQRFFHVWGGGEHGVVVEFRELRGPRWELWGEGGIDDGSWVRLWNEADEHEVQRRFVVTHHWAVAAMKRFLCDAEPDPSLSWVRPFGAIK